MHQTKIAQKVAAKIAIVNGRLALPHNSKILTIRTQARAHVTRTPQLNDARESINFIIKFSFRAKRFVKIVCVRKAILRSGNFISERLKWETCFPYTPGIIFPILLATGRKLTKTHGWKLRKFHMMTARGRRRTKNVQRKMPANMQVNRLDKILIILVAGHLFLQV
jgi:hypothetical protein